MRIDEEFHIDITEQISSGCDASRLMYMHDTVLWIWVSRYSDELDGQGSIPSSGKIFSLLHNVQTASVDHLASYPMDTRVKTTEVWSWPYLHLEPRSGVVKLEAQSPLCLHGISA
jgi:hypothetical protein